MGQIIVSFERDNFFKTVEHIEKNNLLDLDENDFQDVQGHLLNEIKDLITKEMQYLGKKDFGYFQNLCHHPIQGITCLYIVGEQPKDQFGELQVDIPNSKFSDNVVACLYSYLG